MVTQKRYTHIGLLMFPLTLGLLMVCATMLGLQPLTANAQQPPDTILQPRIVENQPELSVATRDFLTTGEARSIQNASALVSDPSFTERRKLGDGGDNTRGLAVGDMDGDGDLDIVTGNNDPSNLAGQQNVVYLNDGQGNFTTKRNFGPTDSQTRRVTVGDMDGDGDLDIVNANIGYDANPGDQSYVYLNDGVGNFTTTRSFGTASEKTACVAVGDMNGDGYLDIITGNGYPSDIPGEQNYVYINDGAGNFSTVLIFGTGLDRTWSVAVGDMDGDGDLDIVAGNHGQQNVVYLNDGLGNFPTERNYGTGSDTTYSISVGDMDGDGDLDIVTGDFGPLIRPLQGGTNIVYLNDGDGNFTAGPEFSKVDEKDVTTSVAVGDMDSDGDLDIVTGDAEKQNIAYLNDGTGNFATGVDFGTRTDFTAIVAVGDVDADGYLDIVTGNVGGQQNAIYLNDGMGDFTAGLEYGTVITLGTNTYPTFSVLVGDMDSDGDLDIVTGNNGQTSIVYLNEGAKNFTTERYFGNGEETSSIALGDIDLDGDLDIVAGNGEYEPIPNKKTSQKNYVYMNDGSGNFVTRRELSNEEDVTLSVAFGDVDSNRALDIIIGNFEEQSIIYMNDGAGNFTTSREFGTEMNKTYSIAVGDMDGDNDLDIVTGNYGQHNVVYLNDGAGNFTTSREFGTAEGNTWSVSVGDMDGDGNLDIVAGNYGQQSTVYLNDGEGNFTTGREFGTYNDFTNSYAVGDMDGDGDLDIVTAYGGTGGQQNVVYLNDGAGNFTYYGREFGTGKDYTRSVALGDIDEDGDWDIVTGNTVQRNFVYLNGREGGTGLPNNRPSISVHRPTFTSNANFYSAPEILEDQIISVRYNLFDPEADPLGGVRVFYSINGGGDWYTATGSIAKNMSRSNNASYVFAWDTYASGFFGQSDNVVLRFLAYPQPIPTGVPGTYKYTNTTPGPFQWPYASATTFPFRVRGTQVKVIREDGSDIMGALVYRIPGGQITGGLPMPEAERPMRTDVNGYLQGRGTLREGDSLVALLPITHTETYTLYHTSAEPLLNGLDAYPVEHPGVQTLTVSASNPLVLFNLDVSMEWDASNDPGYLEQLDFDLRRVSELLFDWSDGQVALGKVTLFQARENWNEAHIRIYATNRMRPNAGLGGVISGTLSESITSGYPSIFLPAIFNNPGSVTSIAADSNPPPDNATVSLTIAATQVITYEQSQVRMPSTWSRFGVPGEILAEDWPRVLAHELGHYLFFLDDNYLGLTPGGTVIPVTSCPGVMSDPYSDDDAGGYDEFHPEQDWLPGCANTLSNLETGRASWQTIKNFYPDMNKTATKTANGYGPNNLPLAVTQIHVMAHDTNNALLEIPYISLLKAEGGSYTPENALAYLIQGDRLVELGSPLASQVHARGAMEGDRLCVFDPIAKRLGCQTLTPDNQQLVMVKKETWYPDIQVTPITSDTIQVQLLAADLTPNNHVKARLYPTDENASDEIELIYQASGKFVGTFKLTEPALEAFVHVWVIESQPSRETISNYSSGGDPAPRRYHRIRRRWRSYPPRRYRRAPVTSSDGQALVIGIRGSFSEGDFYALQSVNNIPTPPSWVTVVGQAHRLIVSPNAPDPRGSSFVFNYLEGEVPPLEERFLHIYFHDEKGWRMLPTTLDVENDIASAPNQGSGLYALMSSTEIPLYAGWNPFFYSLEEPRTISLAMESITGIYTSVCRYDGADEISNDIWKCYGAGTPDWANDLKELEYGSYWVYVTKDTILYLKGGSNAEGDQAQLLTESEISHPPAIYYGQTLSGNGFTPSPGMSVSAWVNNELCGQSNVIEASGTPAYVIDVLAADFGESSACGYPGDLVDFYIDDRLMNPQVIWDHSKMWLVKLEPE